MRGFHTMTHLFVIFIGFVLKVKSSIECALLFGDAIGENKNNIDHMTFVQIDAKMDLHFGNEFDSENKQFKSTTKEERDNILLESKPKNTRKSIDFVDETVFKKVSST